MTLDDLGEALNAVRPHSDGLIGRGRHDSVTIGRSAHAVDCPFVSNEAERTHHWLEVPDHDSAVERSRDDLSQVGVEACGCRSGLVTLERTLKGRVSNSSGEGTTSSWLLSSRVGRHAN